MSLTPADETIWQVALARLDGKLLAAVTFADGVSTSRQQRKHGHDRYIDR